jgi:hypothetical protein
MDRREAMLLGGSMLDRILERAPWAGHIEAAELDQAARHFSFSD